jgi:hypothetical protein
MHPGPCDFSGTVSVRWGWDPRRGRNFIPGGVGILFLIEGKDPHRPARKTRDAVQKSGPDTFKQDQDRVEKGDRAFRGGKTFPAGKTNSFPAGWERIF